MPEKDYPYLHALNTIQGLGAQKIKLLLASLTSGAQIWQANQAQLLASGIGPVLTNRIIESRAQIEVEREWKKLEQNGIDMLTLDNPAFPSLLREIPNCPYIIYTRGNQTALNSKSIAIVGSRAFTPYGKQVAYALSQDLAKSGIAIVSGLALGIDAMAHRGALDANGITIAIMGNSLDDASLHPRANFQLAKEILVKEGLLVSEYPPVTPATPGAFPARNRIMAGISSGTLVIEAAPESGSLITANLALEFNRDVYAVPGPITNKQSLGTNQLIKSGAKPITSAQDILEEFSLQASTTKAASRVQLPDLTSNEMNVFKLLSPEPAHIDRIIKLSKLETSVVISTLSFLEMKCLAKNTGGQNYIRL